MDEHRLLAAAEQVVRTRTAGRLRADRRGQPARFDTVCPRSPTATGTSPGPTWRTARRACRPSSVVVVRVVPGKLDAQRIDDAPAVGHRNRFARQQRRGRRHLLGVDRRQIVLERRALRPASLSICVGSGSSAFGACYRSGGLRKSARVHRGEHCRHDQLQDWLVKYGSGKGPAHNPSHTFCSVESLNGACGHCT